MDAYIPTYSDGSSTWFPTNEAARELIHLVHIWRDISKLNTLRVSVRASDQNLEKLLLKFMLVEFFSALDHARKLQGLIRKSPKLIVGRPAPARYVTRLDLRRAEEAYKSLWQRLAPLEPLVAKIRNKIGAHRSAEIGTEMEMLWGELDPEKFIALMNQIPLVKEAIEGINIYDWMHCEPKSMTMTTFGCAIIHDWANAFTENDSVHGAGVNPPTSSDDA